MKMAYPSMLTNSFARIESVSCPLEGITILLYNKESGQHTQSFEATTAGQEDIELRKFCIEQAIAVIQGVRINKVIRKPTQLTELAESIFVKAERGNILIWSKSYFSALISFIYHIL